MASLQLDGGFQGLPQADPESIKRATTVIIEAVDDSASASPSGGATLEDEVCYPHPTDFVLSEHPIDEIRELKVAIIGGGLSGITTAALLPAKVPGINLTVFEKNADFGGTWFENTYPGVRCDIPAAVYQSTFSPNTQWSEVYAQGKEIRAYWQSVAKKHDVYQKTRFNTKVTGAHWEPASAKWRLDTETPLDGGQVSEHFDFVITAIGHFNQWKLPDYPGIEQYKGVIRHSSNWDSSFDATGLSIATIGNGASGIQVTTELSKSAAHVDHYARSRTWIAGSFNPTAAERQDTPMYYTPEQLETFKDPVAFLKYRKDAEDGFWRNFAAQLADSEASKSSTKTFTDLMKKRLGDRPEMLAQLVPDFPPHCRRLTPGPGYLEALSKPNVTLIQSPIERFTEHGIVTTDGVHRPVDAVICSTGANTDFAPPFPIVAGDLDLSRDWRPDGKFGFPYSYLGTGTPGFPNLAYLLGPNPAGASGTIPHCAETQAVYIAKMLRKISTQGLRTMTPSKDATDDFVAYCDAFFPRTNLTRNCSSWSNGGKAGARIHGHWPGSAAQLTQIRREPRWEDYEYTYQRPENRFAYWGNGWTKRETEQDHDMTGYLRLPEDNDLRDIHERWWDL
ncbi:hypothetical protein LTR08_004772 [Meristemomyces frigidus]|nr:hypothetical protein LTR08_004772 [Meristemomyces frigidus]